MCAPAAALAVTALSAAYGVYTTEKNAKNQAKALSVQAKKQQEQIYDQKSLQANTRMQQARAERARLKAASAESGLTGVSITDMLNDVDFKAGTDVAQIDRATADELDNSNSALQSAYNRIQQPDYLAAGLQIATAYARNASESNGGGSNATTDSDLYRGQSGYDYLKFTP